MNAFVIKVKVELCPLSFPGNGSQGSDLGQQHPEPLQRGALGTNLVRICQKGKYLHADKRRSRERGPGFCFCEV